MINKKDLVKIARAQNVSDDQSTLAEYSADMSLVNSIRPSCIVKPADRDEVQQIVNLANETLTPLVPVSSGAPHFRGDTIPGTGGAVIVDLSRMKRIINVDRARRVAMIEPGVTFEELIPAVEKEGLRLNMPLLPKKSKSVVGSILEREPVLMPKYQWDISDPLACVEVIFGSGDEFRTGQAAGPGSVEEQWVVGGVQKAPYGPGTASWHRLIQGAQGTMGIVTWASMRCELLPAVEEPFMVGSENLDELLELVSWLIRLGMVNECFILNNTNLAAVFSKKWPGDYQNIKENLHRWILFYTVAGYEYFPEERVASHIKDISDITRRLGLEAVKAAGGISANTILKTVRQPCTEPYWKLRYKGACQDIFFLSIYDKLESQLDVMNDIVEKAGYACSDMGIYLQPVVQGTGCHCEFNLFYNPGNPAERKHIKELTISAARNLMDKGAFFSRPYGETAETVFNRDAASVSVLNKLKKMFDPNSIMNPGKVCF